MSEQVAARPPDRVANEGWSSGFGRRRGVGALRARYRRVRELLNRYRRLQVTLNVEEQLLPVSRNRAGDPWTCSQFLVNYPGSPDGIESLTRWLPTLHWLHQHAPVAVLVGDVTAYRAVLAASKLPCYFGRSANEAEFVAQQLNTKVMLYVNQAKLNLREGGLHDMVHVFLGSPGNTRSKWLNNRLRLFDYVLAPDVESKAWMASQLMHYDADAHVRVVNQHPPNPQTSLAQSPDARSLLESPESEHLVPETESLGLDEFLEANEPLDSDQSPDPDAPLDESLPHTPVRSRTDAVPDADAMVQELLQIRDERDELVEARDKALADRGIALLKGGQI